MGILASIESLYSISGFGVGFLIGMTEMGGGSLKTPLLILLFGIQPATAVGTDLLFAAATKSVGSVVHWSARSRALAERSHLPPTGGLVSLFSGWVVHSSKLRWLRAPDTRLALPFETGPWTTLPSGPRPRPFHLR
jgi:uncharacterized protein